ncbi:hypothetical protein KUTeg_022993 [Tegillarca granosa]|uniref:Uncharacterized protein n=1 Tax=Tegillarca granosa TaxID=220873 RepID=A0ABQ9E6L6_TEGGR|nr:hypothetical protein KUTeg_022993 [Tegillarca granosa]
MVDRKCKINLYSKESQRRCRGMYHFEKNISGEDYVGSWNDYFYMFINDVCKLLELLVIRKIGLLLHRMKF